MHVSAKVVARLGLVANTSMTLQFRFRICPDCSLCACSAEHKGWPSGLLPDVSWWGWLWCPCC